MIQTSVTGEFRASHDDPRGELKRHWHTWQVKAWFPAGNDGRDLLLELDRALGRLDGTHLAPECAWCEPLAKLIGEFLGCDEVELMRDRERIGARWRRD